MRVAEHLFVQKRRVFPYLRVGVEAAAGVVEVDRAESVEPPVLGRAQRVEGRRGRVGRIALEKSRGSGHASILACLPHSTRGAADGFEAGHEDPDRVRAGRQVRCEKTGRPR